MPKRRSGGGGGGPLAKRRRHHLYLVLDDWFSGYSIRKVDLSLDSYCDDDAGLHLDHTEQHLPPAIFRLEASRGLPLYFAAAFGAKIMAMHPLAPGIDGICHSVPKHLVPVFDVRSRGVIFAPRPQVDPAHPIYIAVGDRLFALAAGSFEMLHPPPLDEPGGEDWEWSWCELSKPPFKRKYVTSYAVHPDGRTIFVSIRKRGSPYTFNFDTAERALSDDGKWKQHGRWVLPFAGGAHFDRELDAWVGLSGDPESLGHICSCDVALASPDGQCLTQKLSKEKLFSEDPTERHMGATLVYMGGFSEFCLVQCVCIEENKRVDEEQDVEGGHVARPGRYQFRLASFSLKYDKNGDLTTGNSCRVRYYRVPEASSEVLLSNPVAFWI